MSQQTYTKFELKNIPTTNFLMTALELKDYIDFEVKRVYFITKPQGELKTGAHCHIKDEDELFVMIQGNATAVLDQGDGLKKVELSGPNHALLVPHLVWHHFKNLSEDAIILAMTSTNYDPERHDYCEDYEEFKKLRSDHE